MQDHLERSFADAEDNNSKSPLARQKIHWKHGPGVKVRAYYVWRPNESSSVLLSRTMVQPVVRFHENMASLDKHGLLLHLTWACRDERSKDRSTYVQGGSQQDMVISHQISAAASNCRLDCRSCPQRQLVLRRKSIFSNGTFYVW